MKAYFLINKEQSYSELVQKLLFKYSYVWINAEHQTVFHPPNFDTYHISIDSNESLLRIMPLIKPGDTAFTSIEALVMWLEEDHKDDSIVIAGFTIERRDDGCYVCGEGYLEDTDIQTLKTLLNGVPKSKPLLWIDDVISEEWNSNLQRIAMAYGYTWYSKGKKVQNTDQPSLQLESASKGFMYSVYHSSESDSFHDNEYELVTTLEEVLNWLDNKPETYHILSHEVNDYNDGTIKIGCKELLKTDLQKLLDFIQTS